MVVVAPRCWRIDAALIQIIAESCYGPPEGLSFASLWAYSMIYNICPILCKVAELYDGWLHFTIIFGYSKQLGHCWQDQDIRPAFFWIHSAGADGEYTLSRFPMGCAL